jgi:glucose uptake protein GlcU
MLLMDQISPGCGLTVSQLGIVVNGLIGVFVLMDPQPGPRIAALTLIGCIWSALGGILLGNLK